MIAEVAGRVSPVGTSVVSCWFTGSQKQSARERPRGHGAGGFSQGPRGGTWAELGYRIQLGEPEGAARARGKEKQRGDNVKGI